MSTVTEPSSTAPSHVTAAHPHAAPKSSRRAKARRSLTKPLLIAVAIALVAWSIHALLHAYNYVETENAYLVGHLHQVSSQIDAQVKEVLVHDNQNVKAGDVLVRLDPLEFEIAVQKAQASLAQARAQESETTAAAAQADAQLVEATARVAQAEAQIVQSQAQLGLAQLNSTRNDKLFENGGAIPQADVDTTRSAFDAAKAALDAATANRSAAEASVGSAHAAQKSVTAQTIAAAANVSAAQAAVRDAERQLAYTTVVAPADGRVGNKTVEPGNRVSSGQTLLAVAEPTPWIVANFKETQLTRLKAGLPVEITIDALPDEVLSGKIDSVSPASGAQFALLPPDNATGNFNKVVQRVPVKIVLDPASVAKLGDRLRLGYSVIVSIRVR